jgi:alkanesulfonate monooxygenase SsuD/methylene tetrahydromethanopterin reductase-like flavin-dependent oxidoreductase (luciferase family)
MDGLRFGVSVPNIGALDTLIELGVEADRRGWDGFFLWDHMGFMRGIPVNVFDPWVALAAIVVRTTRIRLGTMVTPVARRRPWKLARETVTLDHLSQGRLILGVGLGAPPDADFELLGEDPDDRVRAEKLDEGLELLQRLWAGHPVDFEGKHYRVRDTRFLPPPRQQPRIPIWVAGQWPSRAPLRRAARYDGVFPLARKPDGLAGDLDLADLPAVTALVRRHRSSAEPFDVVVSGAATDGSYLEEVRSAGATWYLPHAGVEGPGWEPPTVELIQRGPPV